MANQVLFVQGAGAGVHDGWDDKLVASLAHDLGRHYRIAYPHMPGEDDPSYAIWKAALLEAFAGLGDGAVLIGHSVGGTVLINMLAGTRPGFDPAALILIAAPFIGDGGWPSDEIPPFGKVAGGLPPDLPVLLFQGAIDDIVPVAHARLYADALPHAVLRVLPGRDHQLNGDLSEVAAAILRPR